MPVRGWHLWDVRTRDLPRWLYPGDLRNVRELCRLVRRDLRGHVCQLPRDLRRVVRRHVPSDLQRHATGDVRGYLLHVRGHLPGDM